MYIVSQFRYDYYSVSVNANHVYSLTTEVTECYILSKLKEHLTQKMCFGSRNRAQLLLYLNIIYSYVNYM